MPPTSCAEPSDCKHVALGLIFLKHISNAFEAKRAVLLSEDPAAAERERLGTAEAGRLHGCEGAVRLAGT